MFAAIILGYLYHGTTRENLPLIVKHGLRPRDTSTPYYSFLDSRGRKGLFVTEVELSARWWASRRVEMLYEGYAKLPAGVVSKEYSPIILRFDPRHLQLGLENDELILPEYKCWAVTETIPPQYIEVKTGNRWVPIGRFR